VQKANITVDKRAQFSSVYLVRYELALSNDYNYKIDKLQLEGTLHHDSFIFFQPIVSKQPKTCVDKIDS